MLVTTVVRTYPDGSHVAIGNNRLSIEELSSTLDLLEQDHGEHHKEFVLTQEVDD